MKHLHRPLFRLRLVSGRLVGSSVHGFMTSPSAWSAASEIALTVAGHTVVAPDEGGVGSTPAAVALLRTVFENHEVDPSHRSSAFFNGCAINTHHARYDFSVTHVGDAVLLSDFTFPIPQEPPFIRLPLPEYVRAVTEFARDVRAIPVPLGLTDWGERILREQRRHLATLLQLAESYLDQGCRNQQAFHAAFHRQHGCLKQPLQLEITSITEAGDPLPHIPAHPGPRPMAGADPPAPWIIEARVTFGPLETRAAVPLRTRSGDLVLAEALRFTERGVELAVRGVGPDGLAPGDCLRGLQLFYS